MVCRQQVSMYKRQRLHSIFPFFFLCSKMWIETNSGWFQSPNSQREAKTKFTFPNYHLRLARRQWRHGLGQFHVWGRDLGTKLRDRVWAAMAGRAPRSSFAVVVQSLCPILCNPMDYSMPGFPVLHHLPELAQIYVHWVDDAI